MKFTELNLSEDILLAVERAGFETPSPIQEQTIPLALEGKDVIGQAQTGTGKTAAFGLPTLNKIDTSNPTFKSILQYNNGFDLVGESIERNVTKAHLGQAIHDMTQLLINVYNFFQLSPHNVKSQFLDDVKHYFMQNENYSVFLAFSIAGKSRLEHRFNFCIHEQRLFKDSASSQ